MKINPTCQNIYSTNYNRSNLHKKQAAPSFKADYSDKPVPPAGKAIAAASAIALLTGAIYHGVDEFGPHDDDSTQNSIEYVFGETPYNNEDLEDVDTADFRAIVEKHNKLVTKPDTTDTISVDSVKADSLAEKPDTAMGHFHGHTYKVVPKGDTVVLVPIANDRIKEYKKGKEDSLNAE